MFQTRRKKSPTPTTVLSDVVPLVYSRQARLVDGGKVATGGARIDVAWDKALVQVPIAAL